MLTSPFNVAEIIENLHPILNGQRDWRIFRYELNTDPVTGIPLSLTLTIARSEREKKQIRFIRPRLLDNKLNISTHPIYVADIRKAQWDKITIEVGEYFDDLAAAFFAESVEEVP